MRSDGRIDTREAAQRYGCTPTNVIRAMRKAGCEPLVEMYQSKHGGSMRYYFWLPSDVRKAKKHAESMHAERKPLNLRGYNALPKHIKSAVVQKRRLERLRKYYQAKAASRAAA
jgi:hypothetical protein